MKCLCMELIKSLAADHWPLKEGNILASPQNEFVEWSGFTKHFIRSPIHQVLKCLNNRFQNIVIVIHLRSGTAQLRLFLTSSNCGYRVRLMHNHFCFFPHTSDEQFPLFGCHTDYFVSFNEPFRWVFASQEQMLKR